MGYLYLKGEYGRLVFLIHMGLERIREAEKETDR